jgi:transposase InsO family protein
MSASSTIAVKRDDTFAEMLFDSLLFDARELSVLFVLSVSSVSSDTSLLASVFLFDSLKAGIIGELHDVPSAGHLGHHKTYTRVAALFEWPRMQQDVHNYCKTCQVCMAAKAGTQKPAGLLQPLSVPERKWQSVGMDFIVRLPKTEAGHDALMVVTDRLTKMVRCIPTATTVTAPEVAELFVEHVVRLYGVPQEIVSDRDSKFTSAFWQTMFRSLGTKLSMSSSYHPQSDGQSERSNQSVEQVLRCYVSAYNNDWDAHLALAEFSLNSAVNVSTGFSPFRLMYGFEPSSPLQLIVDALQRVQGGAAGVRRVEETAQMLDRMAAELVQAKENIGRARDQAAVQANKHRRDVSYQVGDEVMLSTANLRLAGTSRKFAARWVGPFKVKQLVGPVAVELDLPQSIKLHPVVHVSQMKPWQVDARWGDRNAPPPPIIDAQGEESYLVESILKHRVVRQGKSRRQTLQYLVKWLGYPVWDCTWEPESHFPRDSEPLLEYKLQNKL